ncbi:threonine-phosphate decarboxylase CobD [Methylobacterium frigidaeris]|uniref:8-amino-7-oxononanoate synthase n=1 Tax=Methylobacterium frigidaeris TaxID=2038277 RepID=A0AA37M335_9HYPH|nr:threonine-phosphate decarboxylase CobD [Methylobacterium frigidaeris]PIK74729.1 threonine-phosphate decarboxylase [Methylobacterium frigidaeris]GJD60967.1 Histidinol-phosphate aminotransferase [Methylobacterium frigidaeris]
MTSDGEEGAIRHGGDLGEARRLFPQAPEPWIDLSTGINPIPYPWPALEASAFTRLPARADLAALEAAAAQAYGARPDHVVAAPGTQALIDLIPRLRPPGRVAVVGPTYAEHAASWARAGHAVAAVADLTTEADVVVVVNPNNPDGRVAPACDLASAAAGLAAGGGWLVVDEAFADLEPVASLCGAPPPGCLVLRSFGKTYGLAGLRLGFAVAAEPLISALRRGIGPWAVSGPAIVIGRRALADEAWRREAAAARSRDAARLDALLAAAGGRIVGGTTLFRTADFSDAQGLFGHLGRAGIFVRRFEAAPARLRFGLPPDEAAWTRLAAALGAR